MDNVGLDNERLLGDGPADQLIKEIFAEPLSKSKMLVWMGMEITNNDLAKGLDFYPDYSFCQNSQELPVWADKKLMQEGAVFFARRAEVIMNLLGLLSLPYCYAAANGAMVLYLSQRMRSDAAKRLYETGEFVWDIMAPNAFQPEGKGFSSILKVRLMHAAVRYHTLKSDKWDNSWGLPINQEDMAGTNLSFSLIIIRGLRKMGYTISAREQNAYLHLWNVIGFLLGLKSNLLPMNGKDAVNLERHIRQRQFCSSIQGSDLAASLLAYFYKSNDGETFSNNDIKQLMCFLLEPEVASMIGIESEPLADGKIKLIHMKSFFSEFKHFGNSEAFYKDAHRKFKKVNRA